jgi:acyl-CoA synthetase (NDP forming)
VLSLGAGAAEYAAALTGALEDPGVDAAMVFYIGRYGGDPESVLEGIARTASLHDKPVVSSVVAVDGSLPTRARVANFLFPDECAGVLGRAVERREWLSRPLGERPMFGDLDPTAARATLVASLERAGEQSIWLAPAEAEAMLASHRIAVVDSRRSPDLNATVAAAAEMGAPIALKADFPSPADAGDVDAVLLGLHGEGAVEAGWHELARRVALSGRQWGGAIVQPLVAPGADVLVGSVSDPDLGPVIAVGLGGRQAGLGATAAFGPPPSTDVEADELIEASRSVAIQLEGFRGGAALDRLALRELLLRFALLLHECPELVEVDLNPVRCMPRGCLVLDLRMRAQRRPQATRVKTW